MTSQQVIGVLGLEEKRKDVKFAGHYGVDKEDTKYGFEDEVRLSLQSHVNTKFGADSMRVT